MTARLYILSGASGCGKTTLLNSIAALDEEHIDPATKAVRAPKFSERVVRDKNDAIDDIAHVDEIRLGEYDIAYVINNNKYGIKVKPIQKLLDKGFNPFIIVSDFRVVRQMKEIFGTQAKALYISSAIDAARLRRIELERLKFMPTAKQKAVLAYHFSRTSAAARLDWWDRVSDCMMELESDWHTYATDARSTEVRIQKIRAFHIRYIEYVHLFDHVILNYSENKPEEMAEQVRNINKNIDRIEAFKVKKYPPIFIVAAASGAGKGTLMEMLHFIGQDRVRITSKLAKRVSTPEDRRDGMIALARGQMQSEPEWPEWWTPTMIDYGRRGEFPPEYDIQWRFLERPAPYAVSTQEIQRNLEAGIPQIFVSNMDQFTTFRKLWSNNVVFIYLHRLVSEQENREFQKHKWKNSPAVAEARITEKQDVHRAYIRNIAEFDHVLLNTGFKEDLYDQMFRLLECYRHD
jgi:guanylate kinase